MVIRIKEVEKQRASFIPRGIIARMLSDPLLSDLVITIIGYYPGAEHHHCERPAGIDHHILIYCVGGQGWCEHAGKRYAVKKGEFLVVPRGEEHSYGADPSWEIYWVHFVGTRSDMFMNMFRGSFFRGIPMPLHREETIRLFKDVLNAVEMGHTMENLSFANLGFRHLLGSFIYRNRLPMAGGLESPEEKAISFMKENIGGVLALEQIASHAGFSPSYFISFFRKKTGYSPIDFFINLKMQAACQYLVLSNLKVKEIAHKLGYENPYYFSRIFSNSTGMSPKEYRRKRKA